MLSCNSSHKQNKTAGKTNLSKTSDTLKTAQTNSTHPPAQLNPLSPGTVQLHAKVESYDQQHPMQVTLRIIKIGGYGSATPALAKNTDLKVRISQALLNKYSLREIKERFVSKDTLNLILSYTQGMAIGGANHQWTIISFN